MNTEIVNIQGAINILIEHFKKNNEIWLYTRDHNKGRHKEITTDKGRYYLLFKTEYFQSADRQFNTSKGYFESINKEFLAYCLNNKIDKILVAHPDSKIYYLEPLSWWKIAKEGNYIRTSEMGDKRIIDNEVKVIHEVIYSVPLSSMKRFNPEENQK